MFWWIVGLIVAFFGGVLVMAMCAAAGNADRAARH